MPGALQGRVSRLERRCEAEREVRREVPRTERVRSPWTEVGGSPS